jgi:hypothetical protein
MLRNAGTKVGERDQIEACCFLTTPKKYGSGEEDYLSGLTPLEFVQYPAHLRLRKLQLKVSKYLILAEL